MSEESMNPSTIGLSQREQDELLGILNSFSYILEEAKNNYCVEIYTIRNENMVETRLSYLGFIYHDEDWDCWRYVRAEKITEDEYI